MRIIGHGVDLVEVARINTLLRDHGERFAERCFTEAERTYCDRSSTRRAEHYAARFAAKEAVLKALGTGWRNGISWTDIEVERDSNGAPAVVLRGRTAEIAAGMGICGWLVSLSHTDSQAMASAIAVTDG